MKVKDLTDVVLCNVIVEHNFFEHEMYHIVTLFSGTLDSAEEKILNYKVDYLLPIKEDILVIRVKKGNSPAEQELQI